MTHYSFTDSFKFPKGARLAFMGLVSSAVLTACGGEAPTPSNDKAASQASTSEFVRADDYTSGAADAKVVLTEYASVVCGHCANWHSTVYPDFKTKYVDTGKVLYVFRNFPTAPAELADAGHMIAMCAGEENYFKNIKLQFDRQKQIFEQAGQGKTREAYLSLAKASGLSEEDFIACIQNPEIREKYQATVQSGYDLGVSGTPSFFINGEKQSVYDLESIEAIILPLLGEPIPEKTTDTDTDTEAEE